MYINQNPRGVALILVMSFIMLLAAFATALLLQTSKQSQSAQSGENFAKTLYITEAGISDGIADLDVGGTGNLGTADAPVSFHRGNYYTTATKNPDDTVTLVSTGTNGAQQRKIEVVLKGTLGVDAALTVFGKPKHTKFKMESKKKDKKDPRIDGLPDMVPAIQVQSSSAMTDLLKEIRKLVRGKKIDENSLTGDPLMDIVTGKKKKKEGTGDLTTVPVAVEQKGDPRLSSDLFDKVHDALWDKAVGDYLANPHIRLDKPHDVADGTIWGTKDNPLVTVISGHDVHIRKGSKVSGAGTLVISGDLKVDGGATFDWNGNIIVLGGKDIDKPADGKAKLEVNHGTFNLDGDVFLLGHERGSAEVKIKEREEDKDGFNSKTEINGSILVLPGELAKRARFKIEGGDNKVNGLLVINGHDKAEFKLKDPDKDVPEDVEEDFDGTLTVKGAIALGTDNGKKGDMKIEIKSDVLVQYDSKIVNKQLKDLQDLLKSLNLNLNSSYTVQSWRELL